jgi:hypothetical protein
MGPASSWGFYCGQVAQVVERSPEKAGVGGSTPSLATIISKGFYESAREFEFGGSVLAEAVAATFAPKGTPSDCVN